jgi:hypothetical protein
VAGVLAGPRLIATDEHGFTQIEKELFQCSPMLLFDFFSAEIRVYLWRFFLSLSVIDRMPTS